MGETLTDTKRRNAPMDWNGIEGLERARELIIKYYSSPSDTREKMEKTRISIRRAVNVGKFKKFGINFYHDLLKFSNIRAQTRAPNYWHSYQSYQETMVIIKELYKKYKKTPTIEEVRKKINNFQTAISKGQWKKFGVTSYNDLLDVLNIPVNVERYNELQSRDGLDHYITILKDKYSELGRVPLSNEFEDPKLTYLIHSKKWSEFGVNNYFDLVTSAGLEFYNINWGDLEDNGIEIAVGMALKVHQEKGHIPLSSEIDKVLYPIHKGLFERFGIKDYFDFLVYCGFNPSTSRRRTKGLAIKPKNYWKGRNGYNRAFAELKSHIQNNNELPSKNTHGNIYLLITKKKYEKFGVIKWKPLLIDIINELKKEGFTFDGKILRQIEYRLGIEI
ncbi:MAG: hypothetical protein GPJ54_00060 [Candidatus Heimdallarchaeota archaeon]|nr:hypothetical protein [Candidatus Heimdallarchaeota archaeon]